ncbi:MAG: InlB B-repeat-containing protein [Kiritimatiellae bacterium]|nr:InlB B-repeat-containing protein [Kiritimatiellia bacterium]
MDPSEIKAFLDKASGKLFKTATFDANGGTAATSEVTVLAGGKVGTLPNATRTGYRHTGWFTEKGGGTKVTDSTKVKKNVTYYAQWKANAYTINFHKNGGSGSMGAISAKYGKNVTLPANSFKKSGSKFKGWGTSKKGPVLIKNRAKVKNLTTRNGGTVTLYAIWKKK